MTRDPHAPIKVNCSCVTEPGIVVAGPEAHLLVAAFERDHGHGCGGELIERAESQMGRKVRPRRKKRAAA